MVDNNTVRLLTVIYAFVFGYLMSTMKRGTKRFIVSTLMIIPIAVLNFAGDGISILFGVVWFIVEIFLVARYVVQKEYLL